MASLLGGFFGFFTSGGSPRRSLGFQPGFGDDVAFEEDPTVFESERLQLDQTGAVIGLTATIDKEGLQLCECKSPEGQNPFGRASDLVRTEPPFEKDKEQILKISKCMCRVFIEEGEVDGKQRRHFFGTAFFVGETKLITAGHNIAGLNNPVTRISISLPGVSKVSSTDMSLRKVPLIECKVVGTLYKKDWHYSKDIAILDSGSFRNPDYVPLSSIIPPKEAIIDIIGYPWEIRREWIEAQPGLINITQREQDAKKLFPAGSLLVTRGTVEDSEETMSYHISTCPGMGGSCVLYQGSVIGKNLLRQ